MSDAPAINTLGAALRLEFEENAKLRRSFEERWIEDLRQYLGIYPPEVLKLLKENRRSVAYLRKTKTKVDATRARLVDMLFPAKGERNWSIAPSTTPEVHPDLYHEALAMEAARLGRRLLPAEERSLLLSLAADAAGQMGDEMAGQLADAPGRKSYRANCERLLHQGCLYGCGVLKGPLVERRKREKFTFSDQAGWALGTDEGGYWPYQEFVSIWDVYPDLTAIDPEGLRFVWQNHLKTQKELLDLGRWPGFVLDAIRQHITEKPNGDAELKVHESERRQTATEDGRSVPASLDGRYRLLERWGYLAGRQLMDAGVQVADEAGIYSSNVWILGERVVKAVLAPIEGVDIPYHFYFFSEDETAFFPEGLASILRHPESAFNAAVRMILDNAGICAGPQIAVNTQALQPGEDPEDLHPFKVWRFKSVEDLNAAMKVFEVPSKIQDLVTVAKLMSDWADEMSTPRFMAGEGPTRGAAETVGGLSMLMGAAGITFKGLVNQFDNTITRPFVTALYHWNMRFNPREEIKGDFVIKAVGSSALLERETQAQNVMKAIALGKDPEFRHDVKRRELVEEAFKLLDLPAVMNTKEEAEQSRRSEVQEQARAMVQAVLEEAQKRGVPMPQALANMLGDQLPQLETPQ